MIVDSSALIAMVRQESDAGAIAQELERSGSTSMSAATLLEAGIVAGRTRQPDLDEIIVAAGIAVVAFDRDQADVAREAYARYGKGSGSPARLNLGDCLSYALARVSGEPLLFTGDDFTHTDVVAALGGETTGER